MKEPAASPHDDHEDDLLQEQGTRQAAAPGKRKSTEEYDDQVQVFQSQLAELKRRQEEVERQKREIEELSRKQNEFEEGRRAIFEKLTRGLVVLERQEVEVKREAEQIELIRENFSDQLSQVEAIQPEDWTPGERQAELTRALAIIDQANATYTQARVRLEVLRNEPGEARGPELIDDEDEVAPASRGFGAQFLEGLAFSLPLMIFALLVLAFLLSQR